MNAFARGAIVLCFVTHALACSAPHVARLACKQGMPCWPTDTQWQELAASLDGKLLQPKSPLEPCKASFDSPECKAALEELKNPYAMQDDPGATQSLGWLGAWEAAPSLYAVAAESEKDIQAAVRFAHAHGIKLVIKGTGHDYLGRSSAPDSLLVWTHRLRKVQVHEAFSPEGCTQAPVPALTAEAGARWLEVYKDSLSKSGRYVQGGGCNSVGVAGGFLQGGGFGTWSNKYGIAAASLLEARVVTADGEVRVANACQNPDLFWALKGGGGGTFGVVTQVTLMTHPAPSHFGFVLGDIKAVDDAAYRDLLERFFTFYKTTLMNENWGEHVRTNRNNSLGVTMAFAGMSAAEARAVWTPFLETLDARRFTKNLDFIAVPGKAMWSDSFAKQAAGAVVLDERPDQPRQLFWWKANEDELATYWYAYTSRWIPKAVFNDPTRMANIMFASSRKWSAQIFFNKGQATVSEEARVRNRDTSMNPQVHDAPALVIIAANGDGAPGVPGHEPNAEDGAAERDGVHAAMKIIADSTPGAGSYVNETDYFQPDWQHSFWGTNYERLLAIKRQVDPDNVFTCHHCVGSE